MFKFFNKKNGKAKKSDAPQMADLDGLPLQEGDWVQSLRYELGVCKIVCGELGLEYESVETGDRVSYLKMVDAATSYQKVRKIEKDQDDKVPS